MIELIGIVGLLLLLLSWLSEAYSTVKSGSSKVPFEFALLYFISSVLLSYHAYMINDNVFLVLNLATSLLALLNLYYVLFRNKSSKKVKKK